MTTSRERKYTHSKEISNQMFAMSHDWHTRMVKMFVLSGGLLQLTYMLALIKFAFQVKLIRRPYNCLRYFRLAINDRWVPVNSAH